MIAVRGRRGSGPAELAAAAQAPRGSPAPPGNGRDQVDMSPVCGEVAPGFELAVEDVI